MVFLAHNKVVSLSNYEQYDLQEEDPYLIPGSTCLINKLGISDTATLNAIEAEMSSISLSELSAELVTPNFDLLHFQEIHQQLFSDIYPWAGSLRVTEISKGNKLFLPYKLIQQRVVAIFNELRSEDYLRDLPAEEFVERASYYFGVINMIHAFREGNGRAQRVLLDRIAKEAGYVFTWSAISGEQMAMACKQARTDDPDYSGLRKLLGLNIEYRE
jgi:cell filamentation protein